MTIPWMMNCSHSEDGWCLDCVCNLGQAYQELVLENQKLKQQLEYYNGMGYQIDSQNNNGPY